MKASTAALPVMYPAAPANGRSAGRAETPTNDPPPRSTSRGIAARARL